ncbi:hypothetical protein DFR24_0680 [Panacagrimonas perspica]|uniref:Uncharacterized protein n=1 Tax=Panacagrimonas perspica TaxID=381431 RepID=A0A4V3F648_9GAMM|nr:hypothetical protein [Panacagrimonas perspica]TDU31316.1 hypothetical protein DFR24_0680 [Panacagrimonas perspica]THD02656.1 hypothetical protein B1810_14025 [Panacagrimonas perspica]
MTILNWHCSKTSAIVLADTMGKFPDGKLSPISKVLYLPHSNLVVGGRGISELQQHVGNKLSWAAQDYDEALTILPTVIAEVVTQFRQLPAWQDNEHLRAEPTAVVVIGYSQKDSRFRATFAKADSLESPFSFRVEDSCTAPPQDDTGSPPEVNGDTPSKMLSIARRQYARASEKYPGESFGGQFIVAEMTVNGTRFSRRPIA